MSLNPNVRLYYPEVDTAVHFFHRASGNQSSLDFEAAAKVIKRVLAPFQGKWMLAGAYRIKQEYRGPSSKTTWRQ